MGARVTKEKELITKQLTDKPLPILHTIKDEERGRWHIKRRIDGMIWTSYVMKSYKIPN